MILKKQKKRQESWDMQNSNKNIFERLAEKNQSDDFDYSDNFEKPEFHGNIFERFAEKARQKEENTFGFIDTLGDIAQQVPKKAIEGALGSYGNILQGFGLQPENGKTQLKNQQLVNDIQADLASRVSSGEQLSPQEIKLLSDLEPSGIGRFPTSKEVGAGIQKISGIGEGKTPAGRIAGRGAEFLGEGAALGGGLKTLAGLGGSGIAGQSLREAGMPESLATATEIVGSLTSSALEGKVRPRAKEAEKLAEGGRKIGLSEKQLSPLLQNETKISTLSKVARKNEKTKNLFSSIKSSLGDSYDTLKKMPNAQNRIPAQSQSDMIRKFADIRSDLSRTLNPSPDKASAIKYIDDALDNLRNKPITPEELMNFWQDINKSVKWNSINGGKKTLAKLKSPISDVLQANVPEIAKDFEITNTLYSKYASVAKKMKPDMIDAFLNKAEILGIPASSSALIFGNPWPLAGVAGEIAVRTLATEMITNPYFQNISNKMIKNFDAGSVNAIKSTMKQVKEYMDRKHPNEDWDFLIEE